MTRRQHLESICGHAGLFIHTWSPGDGITRYRFFTEPGQSYYGPKDGIYTALGIKEACNFAMAYKMGKQSQMIDTASRFRPKKSND